MAEYSSAFGVDYLDKVYQYYKKRGGKMEKEVFQRKLVSDLLIEITKAEEKMNLWSELSYKSQIVILEVKYDLSCSMEGTEQSQVIIRKLKTIHSTEYDPVNRLYVLTVTFFNEYRKETIFLPEHIFEPPVASSLKIEMPNKNRTVEIELEESSDAISHTVHNEEVEEPIVPFQINVLEEIRKKAREERRQTEEKEEESSSEFWSYEWIDQANFRNIKIRDGGWNQYPFCIFYPVLKRS